MNEQVETGFKKCPQCGAVVFADMDTCYGCLYSFKNRPAAGGPGIISDLSDACDIQDRGRESSRPEPVGQDWAEEPSRPCAEVPVAEGHLWSGLPERGGCGEFSGACNVQAGPATIPSCPQRLARPLDRAALAVYDRWCEEEPEYVEAYYQPSVSQAASGDAVLAQQAASCNSGFGLAISAPGIEFRIPVPKEGIWFGSSPESDIILNSKLVPGKAAQVIPYATGLCVVPENSTSTVFRDGIDMRTPFQIHKSDIFYISNIRIRAF